MKHATVSSHICHCTDRCGKCFYYFFIPLSLSSPYQSHSFTPILSFKPQSSLLFHVDTDWLRQLMGRGGFGWGSWAGCRWRWVSIELKLGVSGEGFLIEDGFFFLVGFQLKVGRLKVSFRWKGFGAIEGEFLVEGFSVEGEFFVGFSIEGGFLVEGAFGWRWVFGWIGFRLKLGFQLKVGLLLWL